MFRHWGPAVRIALLMTVVTGLIYPALVTGLCQLLFPSQASGSLVVRQGKTRGSLLLAQNFSKPEYFHPRPSAANYDATASTGSNLGPTNQKLWDRLKSSAEDFRKENPDYTGTIPSDAITASGSGLDPEISIANAQAQSVRVAKARNMTQTEVASLIKTATTSRWLGILGEPRVNVLQLNLGLDAHSAATAPSGKAVSR